MTELVQELVNGVSLGSTYALLALGLAMVFSILGLINFAHGELVTICGYTMWTLFNHDVPWPAVLVLTLVATTLAAIAMERIAFRPLRGASIVTLLITSFAVSFFIQVSLQIFVSAEPQGIGVPNWTDTVWHVGDFVLGLATSLLDANLHGTYVQFSQAFALAIVVGILLLRPQGLIGRSEGLT